MDKKVKLKLPKSADLLDYSKCNASCVHCSRAGIIKAGETAPKIRIVEAIDAVTQLDIDNFNVSGGEPTLNPHLNEFIFHASSEANNKIVSLDTNGWWGRDFGAAEEKLLELEDLGVHLIALSLDGVKTTHDYEIRHSPGLYRGVMNIIKAAGELKEKRKSVPTIKINITAQPGNIKELELLVKELQKSIPKKGGVGIGIYFVTMYGRAADLRLTDEQVGYVKSLRKKLRGIDVDNSNPYRITFDDFFENSQGCEKAYRGNFDKGKHVIGISTDGNVLVCPTHFVPYGLTLGNIKKNTLPEILEGYHESDFRRFLGRGEGFKPNKERRELLEQMDKKRYENMAFPNYCVPCAILNTFIYFMQKEADAAKANDLTERIAKGNRVRFPENS